ncbi:hypothetical protein CUJ83_05245 [Methanocella sp. CWC-04]|uniref:Uncharacterized protein n=1 Tax=Methanooceanicella nereidis TaxID=2052831 RepID=A0AAP2W5K3_9EURY|nr:hypothetical protein [Methanocella sp. CWC-04]MCD1294403.1 hypothetical protein [Methanocella sp. CWC-04]
MRLEDDRPDETERRNNIKFERLVSGLFSPEHYAIERKPVTPAADQPYRDPDIIIKHKKSNQRFAVVCVFRQDFSQGQSVGSDVIRWSSPNQIKHYQDFQSSKKLPVFVVAGVKGFPDNPEHMYCIPLDSAKTPEIPPSVYGGHRKPVNKPFFYMNGKLK